MPPPRTSPSPCFQAFSATETVESHYQIASTKLLTLAPQTYVNCVKNPNKCGGTGGCEGATMELAFNLTVSTGIALETDMPYQGRDEASPGQQPRPMPARSQHGPPGKPYLVKPPASNELSGWVGG